ncbi:hypothetical protein AGABI2DRAFT_122905 [Agaricus bisporus var. bisporus H97]|uniref:hypothetical protein n=1 Tax=Agaricus bisporus var. bisporus (strain H97 / ATCC MYA-4626 / FGSC 10389) TaxID=936046 RepID=UPI00029F67DE|nr:hypothetical protein AGABI2DRAFT_122905 [Agaricus bisporus var. bisporus H97]EKV42175.1 hypothetical protein AGABI2DRAFT_122905 [Agaricus bisporus var. bisporus H97]
MVEHEPNDAQIHADCAKFNADSPEEASIILWKLWRSTRQAQYSTQPACLDALSADTNLHTALKRAHSTGSYDIIRNWASHNSAFGSPSPDCQVEKSVQDFLQEIEDPVSRIVAGHTSIPIWSFNGENVSQAGQRHLANLKIPALGGKPSLLLHNWGRFSNDPILKKRLENLFVPNSHTFLVNTSGSGKTRLLFEGLCQNWGFYFTSLVDSSQLGSSDVQKSIQAYIPHSFRFHFNLPSPNSNNYATALRRNRCIARRIFRRVLLARLIIFTLFAEKMDLCRDPHSSFDEYKKRWLLLQVLPQLGHPKTWDIFDKLASLLSTASDNWVTSSSQSYLERARELSASEQEGFQEQTPFFCVLDEAQYAATQHTDSFRSDQNDCSRPILREIVRAWEEQSCGQGVFMVVAGTGISKDVVDSAMTSAIMKDSRYRWCSDTGAFDTPETQRQYLTEYLPKSLVQSESGMRLLDRLWYWLHGRHRFTAGYVAELIRNGFRQPHRLLNAYVQHFTKFSISDADKYVEHEEQQDLPKLSQYRLDFSKLRENTDMLTTIHQITTHYLMRSITPSIGGDEAMYVEYGFARFVDSETQIVSIDEPLVLLAAIQWMNTNHQSNYKILARDIRTHNSDYNGFENYIAFCLDLIFSEEHCLSNVFNFHGTVPAWADMKAQLVSVFCEETGNIESSVSSFTQFVAPSVSLGINTKDPELLLSWLGHRFHTPFCFPHRSMGPDVLFVLKLSDGSHIWVALQTKWCRGEQLSKQLLLHAMKSVTPSKYFLDKNGQPFLPASQPDIHNQISQLLLALPRKKTEAGKYSLLRVVASFPGQAKMKRCIEKDPDQDGHPIATLNMELVNKITEKLSPSNILRKTKAQEVQEVKKTNGKRKKEKEKRSQSAKKRIKI